jgi:hypothetical protein
MIDAIINVPLSAHSLSQSGDAGNMSEDRCSRAKLIEYWKASSIVKLSRVCVTILEVTK